MILQPAKRVVCAGLALMAVAACLAADVVARFDERMRAAEATATDGVRWIDGRDLPLEGRAFAEVENFYDRLPKGLSTNVNEGARTLQRHASGLQFRFRTDSDFLLIRMTPFYPERHMENMTDVGASGFDVYRQAADGRWRFVASSQGSERQDPGTGRILKRIPWRKGDAALVNLPLYNGVRDFALGVAAAAKVEPLGPRRSGVVKPVVFYGTSITQGGCATRPGLGFVNLLGRQLDVPVVDLGFAGCGWMEPEMAYCLARVDASCYVLDCLWNMSSGDPRRSPQMNFEPFVRRLRELRPGVPIVLAEKSDVFQRGKSPCDRFIRGIYDKLIVEGWRELVYLDKEAMFDDSQEGTVDGVHPNDLGMMSMAKAFGEAVRTALKLRK